MFGRKKRKERQLAAILEGDQPGQRLLAAMHRGARAVVDGDAASTRGWPDMSTGDQRQALVEFCDSVVDLLSLERSAMQVFFDRSTDGATPRSKLVTIELTEDRTSPAERAIEEIETGDSIVAVWNDDPNAVSLRAAGATVYLPDDLLDAFLGM